MKKIFNFGFVLFLAVFIFGNFYINPVFAEDIVLEAIVETPDPVTLSGITITHPPDKTEYILGDSLDITSLEVTGTYSDESTSIETITEENISGFNSTVPAIGQILTITVGDKIATYNINVNEPEENTGEEGNLIIEGNIILKNGCTVKDRDEETHIFPEKNSQEYLAICALEEALEQDLIDNVEFVDFGFGLFVNSVNSITQENTYWKLSKNGAGASVGVSQLEVGAGDIISLVLTSFDPVTFEETPLEDSVTLTIDSLSPLFNNIELPDHCSVADSAGIMHEFPEESSLDDYLAVCALVSAKETGKIRDFKLNDSSFGLYVQSVNGEDPSETEFWALWLNGEFANCGVVCLPIQKGDVLSLILTNWMDNTESTNIKIRIIDLVESEENGNTSGGGSGGGSDEIEFSVPDAISYLQNSQDSDGSFGNSELYADWAAIAYGASDVTGSSRNSLLEYLSSNNSTSSVVTDNERRAMALLSLGENPYSFNGVNYIKAITDSFDGTQIGDVHLDNDDIFGLIVLPKVGYKTNDEIISKTISLVLSAQSAGGAWDNSVDMTAAAIQALEPFKSTSGVSAALSKATDYLAGKQNSDGGWNNSVFSTSWVMQAESALGTSWVKDGKSGLNYLATEQTNADNDGSLLASTETLENNIWATSYAIPAGLGKTWSEIMEAVSKPSNQSSSNNSSDTQAAAPDASSTEVPDAILQNNETNLAAMNVPAVGNNTNNSPLLTVKTDTEPNSATDETLPNSEPNDESAANALTATAANALPDNNMPHQSLPIVLGVASGLILLCAAMKSWLLS